MLAVRAYNCDGSEDFKVNGQAGGRRSETVRVYYDREAVSPKRRKQFASVCAEGFFKAPHNQRITMPIWWSMGGFTMNPQGEYNKRIYLYSGKRTIKQESENTDCLDSSDSLSPTDAQRGASVLFLPFHRQ